MSKIKKFRKTVKLNMLKHNFEFRIRFDKTDGIVNIYINHLTFFGNENHFTIKVTDPHPSVDYIQLLRDVHQVFVDENHSFQQYTKNWLDSYYKHQELYDDLNKAMNEICDTNPQSYEEKKKNENFLIDMFRLEDEKELLEKYRFYIDNIPLGTHKITLYNDSGEAFESSVYFRKALKIHKMINFWKN
jgi:hypothetical protein